MASSKQHLRTNSIVLMNENQLIPVVFCLLLHARQFTDNTLNNLQSTEAEDVFAFEQSTTTFSDVSILSSETKTLSAINRSRTPLFTENSSFSPLPSQDSFSYRSFQPANPYDLFVALRISTSDHLCPSGTDLEESGSASNKTICFSADHSIQYSSKRNGKQKQSIRWTTEPESQQQQPKSQPQQQRWAA